MIISAFARRLATGLFAAHLSLAGLTGVGLASLSAAPAAAETVLPDHGAWHGFTTTMDGQTVLGAVTEMSKGGGVAFAVSKGKVALWLWKKDWTLPVGKSIPMRIKVGSSTFTGTAVAKEANFIEFSGVTEALTQTLMEGDEAALTFAGIEWTLSLDGFVPSLKDALNI